MQQNNNVWDFADHWKNIPEPAQPNISEINWLRSYVKPEQRILILGSTPEYRDLCAEIGATVTVVDFSENTYKSLTRLMSQPADKEHFSCQDWLQIAFHNQYDLVLGDHVVNLLAWHNLPKLCENIKHALKATNALWITRIITLDGLPNRSMPEIITNYRTHYSDKHFFSMTAYDVFKYCLDSADNSISLGQVWQTMHQFYEAGVLNEKEFAIYNQVIPKDAQGKGYFYSKQALEELFKCYFTMQGTAKGDLYYKDQTYFYLL